MLFTLSALLPVLVASIVLFKNPKSWLNRHIFFFILMGSLWTAALSRRGEYGNVDADLLLVRMSFAFACLMVLFLFFFVKQLTQSRDLSNAKTFFLILLIVATAVSATPLVIDSVQVADVGLNEVKRGIGYPYVVLVLLYVTYRSLKALKNNIQTSSGADKVQRQTILTGLILGTVSAVITNVILPLVTNNSYFGKFIFLAILVWSVFLSYSIVKHRFLDIKLIIARSIAYLLAIATLALLYGVGVFAITNQLFPESGTSTGQQLVYISFAAIVALTFQPLKKFFDRITSKVFYRDAYDSENLLNDINNEVVSSLGVDELLEKVTTLIAQRLKAEYCIVGLRENTGIKQKIIGTKEMEFDEKDITLARGITPNLESKILVTDFIEEKPKLKAVMRKYDIAMLARLANESRVKGEEGLGYLILGPKKSGNIYNSQDIKVMEIIANELVIAIENALRFEEIKAFSETLQQRVQDATSELKTKNSKLRELDKAKDDFISMASHQLRTPLTTVKGYLSMLNDGDFGKVSKKQQQILELAYNSSERMVYLIADLLNVSRINTGKFVIDKTEVDLRNVVKSEVNQLESSAKAHNVTLEAKLPKYAPTVMLDESKIRQVMMNFIDNAIYYTPDGGKITVQLNIAKDALEFTVTDTGIGVPKDEQEHMFTKFYRAKNARQARPDGTGLGLYLAKKVVTAQGGSIIFKSKEGKGSTFGFRFSLATVAAKKK